VPWIERDFGKMYFRKQGSDDSAVILLHEYFGTGDSWAAQRSFLPRYFTVLTPDLRGHGRSYAAEGRITVTQISSDIIAMMDQSDLDEAHLVGCSLGAIVALDIARRFQERVTSVVATSIPVIGEPSVLEYGRKYVDDLFPKLETSLDRQHGAGQPGYARAVLLSNFAQDLAEEPADHADATGKANEITRPVLIIAGDKDPVLSPSLALKLADRVPGASLGLVPHTGHLVHQEMPAVFNEFVLDHLIRAGSRR
jgi:3-oxoadipate enol-lactonase